MKLVSLLLSFTAAVFQRPACFAVANDTEAEIVQAANALGGEAVFDVQQDGKLFVPFGEYPHAKGLQKFDRASGEKMVAAFNSIASKVSRWLTKAGAPIYKGHPDVPGRPDSNPAAPAVGWVTKIAVENDGVSFDVKWGDEGKKAVENCEFRFYSPHWNCQRVAGGIQPVELLSIGLTNNPRINVPAIANDTAANDMTAKVIGELRTLFGLPEGATVEQLNDKVRQEWWKVRAHQELICILGLNETTATEEAILAAARGLKEKDDKLTKAENDLATAQGDLGAAQNSQNLAELSAAKHRKNQIGARIDVLVHGNKLTAAQRDEQLTKLVALANDVDVDAAIAELGKATKLPIGAPPLSKDLGKKNSDSIKAANDRQGQISAVVAEEEAKVAKEYPHLAPSARYDIAFNRARKTNPAIFGNA